MKKYRLNNPTRILMIMLMCFITHDISHAQGTSNNQIQLIINLNPMVHFGYTSDILNSETIKFTDLSFVDSSSIAEWHWDFGDDSTSIIQNPTHIYKNQGYYDVTLTVKSITGCQSSLTKTIFIGSLKTTGITVNNPNQCLSGNSFAFSETGNSGHYSYVWNFGDGNTSSAKNPVHHYSKSGNFQVQLITTTEIPEIQHDTMYLNVRVIPTPNVHSINHVFCDAEEVPVYYFKGDFEGTTFHWHRILGQDVGIGLTQTSGIDSIPAFTAENVGIRYLSPAYRVTPYFISDSISCIGTAENFLITVNPVPIIADVIDQIHCANESVNTYTFTGNIPDAHYVWKYIDGDRIQGLPATGINQMPAFNIRNNSSITLSSNYEVTPMYSFANRTCYGISDTFSIHTIPDNIISLTNKVSVCNSENEISLFCKNNFPDNPLYYKLIFSDKALEAGFSSSINYIPLTNDSILITIPIGINPGQYIGHINIQNNYSCGNKIYDFVVNVNDQTTIVNQPEKEIILCPDNGSLYLNVTAEGTNLSYQWYKNDTLINGAVDSVYEIINTDSTYFGNYSVKVHGNCGSVISQTTHVIHNPIVILPKWDDLLFVSARDSTGNIIEITSLQWYRVYTNGQYYPIVEKGQSQYFSETNLAGSFSVEVTLSDGSKHMSCPYIISAIIPTTVKVYPNPSKSNEKISVALDLADEKAKGSTIEVFDELGRTITKKVALESITDLYLNVAVGTYIFRVTEPSGKITNKKVLLK